MNKTPDEDRSNDQAAGSASSGTPQTERSSPERGSSSKPRSKTERNIVWGSIAVLLVILGFELRSYVGFKLAYDALSAAMEADAAREDGEHYLTETDVKQILKGAAPAESERLNYLDALASRVDTYQWKGLLRTRSLYVYYGVGDNPDVVSVALEKGRTSESYFEHLEAEQEQDKPADAHPAE